MGSLFIQVGRTALHKASKQGALGVVRSLLNGDLTAAENLARATDKVMFGDADNIFAALYNSVDGKALGLIVGPLGTGTNTLDCRQSCMWLFVAGRRSVQGDHGRRRHGRGPTGHEPP